MEEATYAEDNTAPPAYEGDEAAPPPPTAEVALAHLDEAATALQREGRFLEVGCAARPFKGLLPVTAFRSCD